MAMFWQPSQVRSWFLPRLSARVHFLKPLMEGLFILSNDMSILNFVTRSNERSFVQDLVAQLVRNLPPEVIAAGRSKVSVNKITRHLEKVYLDAASFQSAHKIGFLGRAVMANAFKWGLKEASYPDEFVDMATEGFIVALSKVNLT